MCTNRAFREIRSSTNGLQATLLETISKQLEKVAKAAHARTCEEDSLKPQSDQLDDAVGAWFTSDGITSLLCGNYSQQ